MLQHRGYAARVDFDSDDLIFVGHIAGIEDSIGFHADTVDGLVEAFREAVDDYLETCRRIGKPPEKPLSGTVYLRAGPELHARAAVAAKIAGKSLNQFGVEALQKATEQLPTPTNAERLRSSIRQLDAGEGTERDLIEP